ncbi:hypothetical protein ACUY3H_04465 [Corynebacterium ureicelerivorans]
MTIEFATNNANTARKYLEEAGDVGPEVTAVLLDGVKNGICRVRDPYMYGGQTAALPETKNADEWSDFLARINEAAKRDKTKLKEVTK